MNELIERLSNYVDDEGFTLVELMVVVAIIGILAAIAVPQFTRTITSSKAAEADSYLSKMADGASSYFQEEQVITGGQSAGGAQWWHSGGTNGMPVAATAKTYPGGTGFSFNISNGAGNFTQCSSDASGIPANGEKKPWSFDPNKTTQPVISKLGVNFAEPSYFMYSYKSSGKGTDATATAAAEADFDGSGDECHTVQQQLEVSGQGVPKVIPSYVKNEGL